MARAAEEGVAAYVDAVEDSVGMYLSRGWEEVVPDGARVAFDLTPFGGTGSVQCVGLVWEGRGGKLGDGEGGFGDEVR